MGINVKKKKSVFSELSVCPKKRDPDGLFCASFFYSKDWSLFLFDVVLAIVDGCKDISPVIRERALTKMADDIAQYKGRSPKQPKSFFILPLLFCHYGRRGRP